MEWGGDGAGMVEVEVENGSLTPSNLTQAFSQVLPHVRKPRMLSRCQLLLLSRCQLRLLSRCQLRLLSRCQLLLLSRCQPRMLSRCQLLLLSRCQLLVLSRCQLLLLSHCQLRLLSRCQLRLLSWCVTVVVVSDQFSFLTLFATAADDLRLLVWSTRLLVVSRLPLLQLHHLLSSYWAFSMMNTAFLAQRDLTTHTRWQALSHLPYSTDGPKVVQLASWTLRHGLIHTHHLPLFPDKYANFHGARVNMSLFSFAPFWIPLKKEGEEGNEKDTTTPSYTGRSYKILSTIATQLNFSFNLILTQDITEEERLTTSRESMLSPMKMAILSHKLERFDFSLFIEPATLTFAMAKPLLKPQWQSLYQAMQGQVWLAFLATICLVPVSLVLIIRGAPETNPSLDNNTSNTNNTNTSSGDNNIRVWTPTHQPKGAPESSLVVLEVVGVLVGQGFSGRLLGLNSSRLVVASWLLVSFITGVAYRASLFASLTVPKYPPRPESLQELVQTEARVLMPPDVLNIFYPYFKTSNSSTARQLVQHIEGVPTHDAGLRQALKGSAAYVYEGLFLRLMLGRHYTDATGWSPLYVAREYMVPGYSAWLLQRDAPYKHAIDDCILAFHGGGLIRKWSEVVVEETTLRERLQKRNQQKAKEKEENENEEKEKETEDEGDGEGGRAGTGSGGQQTALTLVHLTGPLFLLLLGCLVSLLIVILEVLVSPCLT
ncbi:hypothetical protein Pcinc_017653 [Petrolisthes cinctipes]|uniref:Ionotropic glutamate receptor C-terminal domain-containing protein n=1 Tax=Petrolisthes cinctipes TaxID=88211 RepID=A0AAE1FTR2_PETCI|nr:hypothetical protein Pcinc_017653 [Petrolisthes cinctipes]